MKNKEERTQFNRIKGNRVCKYYPTTLEEALSKIYEVKPQLNNKGDFSSGKIIVPKVLNGFRVKLILKGDKNEN